ncbi:hypothetical protein ACFY0B_41615, partial [Streptomyces sp. NPDC001797]|uniref:hypothetical protein n=1 Tax=Streptomyces sp. NPDC001797 TaxID=3364610 RepID=UPI0036C7BF7D
MTGSSPRKRLGSEATVFRQLLKEHLETDTANHFLSSFPNLIFNLCAVGEGWLTPSSSVAQCPFCGLCGRR